MKEKNRPMSDAATTTTAPAQPKSERVTIGGLQLHYYPESFILRGATTR